MQGYIDFIEHFIKIFHQQRILFRTDFSTAKCKSLEHCRRNLTFLLPSGKFKLKLTSSQLRRAVYVGYYSI